MTTRISITTIVKLQDKKYEQQGGFGHADINTNAQLQKACIHDG